MSPVFVSGGLGVTMQRALFHATEQIHVNTHHEMLYWFHMEQTYAG